MGLWGSPLSSPDLSWVPPLPQQAHPGCPPKSPKPWQRAPAFMPAILTHMAFLSGDSSRQTGHCPQASDRPKRGFHLSLRMAWGPSPGPAGPANKRALTDQISVPAPAQLISRQDDSRSWGLSCEGTDAEQNLWPLPTRCQ